ncbi:hypothetical protein D9619_009403 [Psilocybe cf. subviscida]|uniref:Uncharacterized protein n=1 Tax=Psilocybe cf. subviscida TaxID=2480587 RepID=A0A8H5FAD8_9AGAR|nr:hypothetical protein D9619_009403 [Psilocybe cf. subviscida]
MSLSPPPESIARMMDAQSKDIATMSCKTSFAKLTSSYGLGMADARSDSDGHRNVTPVSPTPPFKDVGQDAMPGAISRVRIVQSVKSAFRTKKAKRDSPKQYTESQSFSGFEPISDAATPSFCLKQNSGP